jgi:N-acetyl-gamma-glutamyl-phosphate reductase
VSVPVAIAGASGYAGAELIRLLSAHPAVRIAALAGGSKAGQHLREVWPALGAVVDLPLLALDDGAFAAEAELVFLALPHGLSGGLVPRLLDQGKRVFDLGADFRLRDPALYAATYGHPHPAAALLDRAVYGLPELHRAALPGAALVAVPGCYPTATALAALPLVEAGLVDWLVSDCISGISGAGRAPGPRNLFCEVHDSAVAYGLAGAHRHTPEIEQTLGVPVSFTPHLAPLSRGMVATVHGRLLRPLGQGDLRAAYAARYADHPMVVLRDAPPATHEVRGTNRAALHVAVDDRRGVVTALCAIDNLGKGAAGQAVQCMNLALGWAETLGLPLLPVGP